MKVLNNTFGGRYGDEGNLESMTVNVTREVYS